MVNTAQWDYADEEMAKLFGGVKGDALKEFWRGCAVGEGVAGVVGWGE